MTMPNFFIVGAQKAGTTSLYHYLNQHPQVYMSPIKEPFFFDHEMDSKGEVVRREFEGHRQPPRFTNIEEYSALFEGVRDEKAIGEATPLYIYAPGTAERIERYVPGAKSIALLRNPADRAYSAFLYAVRMGVEPLTDFAQALREEPFRMRNRWHYVFHYRSRGLYYQQLKRYYEVFGRERLGVWLYEDLREDPAGVAQECLPLPRGRRHLRSGHFLEVQPGRRARERIRPRRDEGNEQGGLGPPEVSSAHVQHLAARLQDASSSAEPGPHRAAADRSGAPRGADRRLQGRHPEAAGAHRAGPLDVVTIRLGCEQGGLHA